MSEWLDELYAQKKGRYQGVRKQYRICQKAIKAQRLAYNELERSMIAYHRMQGESISKIDDVPAINDKLMESFARVQQAKFAHDAAMDALHTSLPDLFDKGHVWILDGMLTLKTELNIPYAHIGAAFGMVPDLLRRWLRRKKDD